VFLKAHCFRMDRVQYPSADFALLLYLACVTAVLGLFVWSFYGLMQPTTVPNLGLANYKEPRPITVFLHKIDTSMEQMERTAIAAAREDNKEQGIEPLRAFAAAEPALANASAPRAQGAVVPTAKQPKHTKPKQVVRREVALDPWRSWELAFRSNNSRPGFNGGGGRDFWAWGGYR
jgi:hypothetical protein